MKTLGKMMKFNKTFVSITVSSILFFSAGFLANQQISRNKKISQEKIESLAQHNLDICQSNDLSRMIMQTFSLNDNGNFILINKNERKLYLYDNFKKVNSHLITIGKQTGNKLKPGDNRTPEGIFIVKSIDDSSDWVYDDPRDNLEPITGAYGPWFIRLEVTGFSGIGIHGFYNNEFLGKRASHGCVRLNTADIDEIAHFATPGMPVIILPDEKDASEVKSYIGDIAKGKFN